MRERGGYEEVPRTGERDYSEFGRGLLRIDSIKFMDNVEQCQVELNDIRSKFKMYMQFLVDTLKKYTKKGVYSYLDEAFIRFNFNSYYMSREREGLE